MISLPDVTLICVDTVQYGEAIYALTKSLEQISPARTIFFTDIVIDAPDDRIEIINIKHLFGTKDYSKWMLKELGKYAITTSHILVIQADGYVLDAEQWTDEFLKYSYIGAPWLEVDGHNVGNGGFSLREFRLHEMLSEDEHILPIQPEDTGICRIYRNYLELKYGFTWAPVELAHKFSFELNQPKQPTFGFHQGHYKPFKEYVVIKRTGAIGDVIQLEPVLHYFHEHKFNVVLDSPFYPFFGNHYFPVLDYTTMDKTIQHRIINLDMSYETSPKQLHLKSYFEKCGVTDYKLRNPKLNWQDRDDNRIFKKYVVIHIDRREQPHRNQYGIDWRRIRYHLEDKGYSVIQIGPNDHELAGLEYNTSNMTMLLWLIGGCSLFLGVDSGPSNIAVALGKKCVLFFGSVNPEYIHADLHNIIDMQSKCPIDEQGCWHNQISTDGRPCPVDKNKPPCCVYDTQEVIKAINSML